MKMPRATQELDLVRSRILEGALEIILDQGLDCLTMRRLGARIGMTAPNIYNYFAGKDEIYIAIIIQGVEMLQRDLQAAYASRSDPRLRARAMIEAYLAFGMHHSGYYDLMFVRATPKYNDYVGTPHERLSAVEYRISMEIADLALKAVQGLSGEGARQDDDMTLMRVTQVWSLLHGMVSLNNSRIVGYVAPQTEKVYRWIVDDLLEGIIPEQPPPGGAAG